MASSQPLQTSYHTEFRHLNAQNMCTQQFGSSLEMTQVTYYVPKTIKSQTPMAWPVTHHDHAWAIGVNRIDEPLESPLEGWASHCLASISTHMWRNQKNEYPEETYHSEYHHSPNRKISGYSVCLCVCVLFCYNCYRNPNRLWRFHVLESLLPRLQDRLHLTGGQFPGCIGIKVVKRLPAWNPCDGDRFPVL